MSNDKSQMTLNDVKEITEKAGKYDELLKQNQRYKQALEEIKKLTIYDDGTEEEVYNIAAEALEESK